MTEHTGRDAAAELGNYWDEHVRTGRSAPLPEELDPALAATVRRLHALHRPAVPDPAFLSRLRATLGTGDGAASRLSPSRSQPLGEPGRFPAASLTAPASLPDRAHGSEFWARVAAVAMLIVTLAAGATAYRLRPTPPDSQPAHSAALAGTGAPVLTITETDTAIELPGLVPAGRYVVTVENASSRTDEVVLARLPPGLTAAAALADPHARELPWLLRATYPGAPGAAAPGGQTEAVIDLMPGEYVAFTADAQRSDLNDPHRRMAGFQVGVSTIPGNVAVLAPSADASVELTGDAIIVPERLSPGRHVWEVSNTGQGTCDLRLLKAPRPVTLAQVQAVFDSYQQPSSGGLDDQTLMAMPPAGGLSWLSPGQPAWSAVDLVPGTYIALCLVRSPSTGLAFARYGETAVLTVRDGAPIVGTPGSPA